MVTIEGRYTGQLGCESTHGPSGAALITDAPVDNQGRGASYSPTDLVATALATCVATTVAIVGERRGVDLSGMRYRVTKEMVTQPTRRIGRLALTLWLPAAIADDERHRLERAAHSCPVHRSLHPDVEAPIEIVYE